jgi:phenylalanyl-tRNA synthetase alpha chain
MPSQSKTLPIKARTAGHIIQLALEELYPEHHAIGAKDGEGGEYYVIFTGFFDESHLAAVQTKVDEIIQANLSIVRKSYTQAEFNQANIIVHYPLPENLKKIGVITIGDYRPITDGGVTLESTGKIGPLQLTECTYDQDGTRVHYQLHHPDASAVSLDQITDSAKELLSQVKGDTEAPTNLHTKYLGKKGLFNRLAKQLRDLPDSDRAAAGKLLNSVKQDIQAHISTRASVKVLQNVFLDVTAPGVMPPLGHLHLITQAIQEIEIIFSRLGFVRRRYPEIESDWYYAEGLNIPKNHPARDDQETFYFSDDVVLTAHTSNGQLREMEYVKTPPIKMINIGKTYRRQASNTHSPMFHQFEGLLVDKGINMTHLVGVSNYFAREYFGPDRTIRLRPHHFQFTEPSFEVDINCQLCHGQGNIDGQKCKICKSGWLELGGAGMVHPQVLKNGGLDPEKYSGFAFGWGVERVIMMKHQVTDNLRQLYTDDLRFLEQT